MRPLRTGTIAEIYELSDRTAFLGRNRPRHLRRMAEGYPAARRRFTVPARSVLPVDVLVLRLPHLSRPPRRAHCRLRLPPCAAKSIWYRGRSIAASGQPHPLWRRNADHHGAGELCGSGRSDQAVLLRLHRPRSPFEIDPRTLTGPMIDALAYAGVNRGEPRRAELRCRGPACDQSDAKF